MCAGQGNSRHAPDDAIACRPRRARGRHAAQLAVPMLFAPATMEIRE
ncbi:hypothetical protein APY03_7605 [Variovorax sp. WDL1]|nr:hypothetical protein APY03_7605 [Variovorax sp. WDL1]